MLTAECVFNKFLKTGRSDRVGYNSTALVTLKCNGSRYSNQAVTVNFIALVVYSAATVNISVKITPRSAFASFTASQIDAIAVASSGFGIWFGNIPSGSR